MSLDFALSLFIQYGYWIVFAAIVLDNAGLPIPGELLLLLFGALARSGDLNLGLGVLVGAAAAMSGDSIGYWLGRLTGDRALRTYCHVTLGSGACIPNALAYYRHYGNATVVVGRFIIGVRAFLSPLAGAAGMPFSRFLLFDSVGALLWSGLFILIGYGAGSRLTMVHEGYRAGSLTLVATLGVGFGLYVLAKLVRRWRPGPVSPQIPTVARAVAALRRLRRPAFTATPLETDVPAEEEPDPQPAEPAASPEPGGAVSLKV